jgi:hypothetical protein
MPESLTLYSQSTLHVPGQVGDDMWQRLQLANDGIHIYSIAFSAAWMPMSKPRYPMLPDFGV